MSAATGAFPAATDMEMACDGECVLCKHMGGQNKYVNTIPAYVAANIDRVSMHEMCVQISRSLRTEAAMEVDVADVALHVKEHICDKKIVLNNILQDLRGLLKTTIKHSVVVNEETSQSSIDHKACTLYLDTVKQVVALYRTA